MDNNIISLVLFSIRVFLSFLSVVIITLCFKSMRNHTRRNGALIILQNAYTKKEYPVLFWENSIGRSKNCDIVIPDSTISRDHAVLFRRKNGWFISDTNSKYGVLVNGKKIKDKTKLNINDTISLGATTLNLLKASDSRDISSNYEPSINISSPLNPSRNLFLVTLFLILNGSEPILQSQSISLYKTGPLVIFILLSWLFFIISTLILKRRTFELETLAIFLSGIGITLISNAKPDEAFMQLLTTAIGMVLFCVIIGIIKNPDIAGKMQIMIAILAVGLFIVNLIFAKEINGAKNWITLASFSIQPSEFIKIAFIFVGASTLDDLQTTKSLTWFILFSSICIGCLFLMKDFGTACIFFVAFLVIAFMRSGSIRTLILSCSAAALGVFLILTFKPYIKDRFSVWGNVWEHANELGFQQTRVLAYSASGGLFGVGVGNGCLKNVFASIGDLMFGVVCEEMGLIVAITIALILAGFSFSAHSQTSKSRSTFYSISSCAAASMLIFQAALHIFGTTDILPLTGVTLPFVSLGGSSMISSFGLLAFIKAADERTYALKKTY